MLSIGHQTLGLKALKLILGDETETRLKLDGTFLKLTLIFKNCVMILKTDNKSCLQISLVNAKCGDHCWESL